jgi:hypothetical protein
VFGNSGVHCIHLEHSRSGGVYFLTFPQALVSDCGIIYSTSEKEKIYVELSI